VFEVRRDAFWKAIGVTEYPVPQGRGHLRFRSRWKESQEKPMLYNVPEMPAKAAELVSKASKEDRKDVAILAVKSAIYKNRTVAATVVAAVSKAAPDLAADVTLAATQMERDQVNSIASAATIAAPAARAEITVAANTGFTAPTAPTTTIAPFATPVARPIAPLPQFNPTGPAAGFGFTRASAADPAGATISQSNQPINTTTGGNGGGSFGGVTAQGAGAASPVDYTVPR
jgi:hypothetical protein